MIKFKNKIISVFAVSFLLAALAEASPVTWTITDATFDDGSSLTGSFIFDADTATFSDIHLVSTWFSNSFEYINGIGKGAVLFSSSDSAGSHNCSISPDPDCSHLGLTLPNLTNAGGTFAISDGAKVWNPYGLDPVNVQLHAGIISSVVPLPAAVWFVAPVWVCSGGFAVNIGCKYLDAVA